MLEFRINKKPGGPQAGNNLGQKVFIAKLIVHTLNSSTNDVLKTRILAFSSQSLVGDYSFQQTCLGVRFQLLVTFYDIVSFKHVNTFEQFSFFWFC